MQKQLELKVSVHPVFAQDINMYKKSTVFVASQQWQLISGAEQWELLMTVTFRGERVDRREINSL